MITETGNRMLVTTNSPEALLAIIEQKVSEGWEPEGGPTMADASYCDDEGELIFVQLLHRH